MLGRRLWRTGLLLDTKILQNPRRCVASAAHIHKDFLIRVVPSDEAVPPCGMAEESRDLYNPESGILAATG
jgi:hypothetical protein